MEVDSDNTLLDKIAAGGSIEKNEWSPLREDIIARLDKIAHNDFPIPKLPPPPPPFRPANSSDAHITPLPSSPLEHPSSQDENKENVPVVDKPDSPKSQTISQQSGDGDGDGGALPKQIADMVQAITTRLRSFDSYPPHTAQRLAELILEPRQHYRALASYLHAVDRVVQVTSGTDVYPLPPAIPDLSAMDLNGEEDARDPSVAVAWSNPTSKSLGSDEALGGALLTPIPWLTSRRSPDGVGSDDGSSSSSHSNSNPSANPNGSGGGSGSGNSSGSSPSKGAQIHSESTETIDGPNGVGRIETVSVSVNGIPSTGHARGITQGELLRQEQRAGVVPVSQLTRAQEAAVNEEELLLQQQQQRQAAAAAITAEGEEGEDEDEAMRGALGDGEEEDETPHARGPEEIGIGDTGPQTATTSHIGEGGLEMRDIDVEAAVGRKHEDEDTHRHLVAKTDESERAKSPGAESVGSKRGPDDDLDGEPAKKPKEGDNEKTEKDAEDNKNKTAKEKTDEADDKMETDS